MMYSGDEYYGDEITSPLYRPLPPVPRPAPVVTIGAAVSVADGLFTGTIVARTGNRIVVELDESFTELPTDQCWFTEAGRVRYPCFPNELDAN